MPLKIVKGNLIEKAKAGKYNVIMHGCNCFCIQGAGIAKYMSKEFGTSAFTLEGKHYRGSITKLGNIDYNKIGNVNVINAYTQYELGPNFDLDAFRLCLKKVNKEFCGKTIGIPAIGCGIGKGNIEDVISSIEEICKDLYVEMNFLDDDMYERAKCHMKYYLKTT